MKECHNPRACINQGCADGAGLRPCLLDGIGNECCYAKPAGTPCSTMDAPVGAKTSFGASQSASFGAANNYSPPQPDHTHPAPTNPAGALAAQVGGDHYKHMAIQPVEYIHRNGIGFCEGCVIKYVSRWRAKGGVQDLEKARHFLNILIEMEGKQ